MSETLTCALISLADVVFSGALAQALDDLSAAVSCADIPSIQRHLESAIYHKREKVRQRHYDSRVQ